MFDLLIRNGMVADGSGAPAEMRDVAITGGNIVAIEPAITGDAREVIDATGKLMTSGFIGIHTHRTVSSPGTPNCFPRRATG